MKLLIQSAMIFFGTLMAAAVVALGEPGGYAERRLGSEAAVVQKQLLQSARAWMEMATPVLMRPFTGWHE